MTKESKPKEEAREPKPKYRSVIPEGFKIRRSPSPMSDILREAGETQATPLTPVTPLTGVTPVGEDVAPKRDFTRVANSIVREAVPGGAFTGKGKQLYDYLYSQTRGAIVPRMSARLRTERVIKASGMSRPTYKAHLARLAALGLIQVEEKVGEHGGNIFTVYLPEEIDNSSKWGNPTKSSNSSKDLEGQVGQDLYPGNPSLSSGTSTTSGDPKTFFKTKEEKIDDDAGARRLTIRMIEIERELTGKVSTGGEKWDELADMLITELKIAAARTNISNVPAFLTEHLRRRLWKVDKTRAAELATDHPEQGSAVLALTDEEKRKCLDCAGVGFWYPEGPEKGVARCTHLKIQGVPEEQQTD